MAALDIGIRSYAPMADGILHLNSTVVSLSEFIFGWSSVNAGFAVLPIMVLRWTQNNTLTSYLKVIFVQW